MTINHLVAILTVIVFGQGLALSFLLKRVRSLERQVTITPSPFFDALVPRDRRAIP